MVKVVIGDVFGSRAQTLVNTVNCVGVMGKGVALGFKQRFPEMYDEYVERCKAGDVKLGRPYLYRRLTEPWILNFPTKDHWRSVSRLDDIIRGLQHLERNCRAWGITSLAAPPLGCGNGQLEWSVVGPMLYRYLERLEIPVELYAPYGTPHEELEPGFLSTEPRRGSGSAVQPDRSRIDPAWIALAEILAWVEREPYHWPIGRTTFQKLAYFATESGIPTGLEYARGSYGPYAPELKRIATKLANNGLIREERTGRMFRVRVGPTFLDARHAYQEQLEQWKPAMRKVVDLFARMHTKQAEIAATVHYVAKSLWIEKGVKPSEIDVFNEALDWKQRRRPPLDETEVALTIRHLGMRSWLDVQGSHELPLKEEDVIGF